jgi:hypothetical protein
VVVGENPCGEKSLDGFGSGAVLLYDACFGEVGWWFGKLCAEGPLVVIGCFVIVEGLLLDEYAYVVGSRWDDKESSKPLVKSKIVIWMSWLDVKERS